MCVCWGGVYVCVRARAFSRCARACECVYVRVSECLCSCVCMCAHACVCICSYVSVRACVRAFRFLFLTFVFTAFFMDKRLFLQNV